MQYWESSWTRRAAVPGNKVLKGAKPADVPVEQPTTLQMVINLTLGVMPTLLAPVAVLVALAGRDVLGWP